MWIYRVCQIDSMWVDDGVSMPQAIDVVEKILRVVNHQFGDNCSRDKLAKIGCCGLDTKVLWTVKCVTNSLFTVKFFGIGSSAVCLFVRFRYDDCNNITLDQIKF